MTEERVSESGGTMTLLTGEVEAATVDLSVLEPLREVGLPVDVRAAGATTPLEPGAVVAWHYGEWVDMMRVVRDDDRGLVAWLPSGSERRVMTAYDGRGLRDRPLEERFRTERMPAVRTWSGPGILRIAPTGRPWSVWYFSDDDGSFGGSGYSRNLAVVSLAGMAFLSGGHTPGRGEYGQQVSRAVGYVLAASDDSGFICQPEYTSHGPMYDSRRRFTSRSRLSASLVAIRTR